MEMSEKLKACDSFDCIFQLVKKSVEVTINRSRAGISLALQDISPDIGAYYPVGSNFIIMNKGLLEKVVNNKERSKANAYIFYILLHEYLHSLGYLDEGMVRGMSLEICRMVLGSDHTSTQIAMHGIGHFLDDMNLELLERPEDDKLEIIDRFDTESTFYIG